MARGCWVARGLVQHGKGAAQVARGLLQHGKGVGKRGEADGRSKMRPGMMIVEMAAAEQQTNPNNNATKTTVPNLTKRFGMAIPKDLDCRVQGFPRHKT